jgi:asparagine synthase (glutamine-hydrolysing)
LRLIGFFEMFGYGRYWGCVDFMNTNDKVVALGRPRFASRDLNQLAIAQGGGSAWGRFFNDWKPEDLARVDGDFAVGLTDAFGRTILAIDRFAIRSLCYRVVGGELHFAERADDLADTDSEIDPQAIYNYLYFHIIPSPGTIYKGIHRLPPGHYAIFDKGELTVLRYWLPEFVEPREANFNSLRDEFRDLLHKAVADQLDGSKPACFLSGGTDSSTITGMIGEVSGQPANAYSIGFEAEGYDEMEFARIAARKFGARLHEYYVTPDDLIRSIPLVAQSYDQPFGNSSALPAYYCAKMAREDGVTRLLAGDGGDELFGGNTRYAKQKMLGFYDQVPAILRGTLLEPLLLKTPLGNLPLLSKGRSYIDQAKVPLPDRTQTYNLLYRLGLERVFPTEFLGRIDLGDPDKQQRAVWQEALAGAQTNRELAFDWRYTLAECDLPKVMGTTALAETEAGFPMLDNRLVDFSMRLPTSYKLKGLRLRWFFKEALRGFLPNEIITKRKQGFGLPFGVWAVNHKPLRDLAEGSLRGLVERGILRAEFVDLLFSRYLQEHPSYYGEMVWISMMMEQWMRGSRNSKL